MNKRKRNDNHLYGIKKWIEMHQRIVIPVGALILVTIILLFYQLDNMKTYDKEIIVEIEKSTEETKPDESQVVVEREAPPEEIDIVYSGAIDQQLCFQIDEFENSKDVYKFNGFCFLFDRKFVDEPKLYLKNVSTNNSNLIEIELVYGIDRADVQAYFVDDIGCENCGYQAIIDKQFINPTDEYEICIVDGNDYILTGTYIDSGSVAYVSQKKYKELDVEGTDLADIVNGSVLRLYNPNMNYYVYQYNNDLYWIVEGTTLFDDDDDIERIEYHIATTQPDMMNVSYQPNRQDRDVFMDKNEITNQMDCGKYRVAKKALPLEYPIKEIDTGCWDSTTKQWVWQDYFRPYYYFDSDMYEWMDNPQEN